jgi:hypothetical protein
MAFLVVINGALAFYAFRQIASSARRLTGASGVPNSGTRASTPR